MKIQHLKKKWLNIDQYETFYLDCFHPNIGS